MYHLNRIGPEAGLAINAFSVIIAGQDTNVKPPATGRPGMRLSQRKHGAEGALATPSLFDEGIANPGFTTIIGGEVRRRFIQCEEEVANDAPLCLGHQRKSCAADAADEMPQHGLCAGNINCAVPGDFMLEPVQRKGSCQQSLMVGLSRHPDKKGRHCVSSWPCPPRRPS